MGKFIQYSSPSMQDIFALFVRGNGTYIDIGAGHPLTCNKTYQLEVNYNWRGISIDTDTSIKEFWDSMTERRSKIYFSDALTVDYGAALKENNLPLHVNYLSCDIDTAENTFAALQRVIDQGITFDCLTFKHDAYQCDVDYDKIATNYLKTIGYKVAVTDVYPISPTYLPDDIFETWYVRTESQFPQLTFDQFIDQTNYYFTHIAT